MAEPTTQDQSNVEQTGRVYVLPPAGSKHQPGWIPAIKAEAAQKQGWTVKAQPSPAEPNQPSALEAGASHLAQGALQGFGDEAYGAVAGAVPAALRGSSPREIATAYAQKRDAARKRLAEQERAHPYASKGAEFAGTVGSSLLAPEGVAAQAALGAAHAVGNSVGTPSAQQVAVEAALGAGGALLGQGLGAALRGGAQEVGPALEGAAAQSTGHAIGANPAAFNVATPTAAKSVLQRAGAEGALPTAGRVTPEAVAQSAAPVRKALGDKLDQLYNAFDAIHGPTVDPAHLRDSIIKTTQRATEVLPNAEAHIQRIVAQISPKEFTQAEKAMEAVTKAAQSGNHAQLQTAFARARAAGVRQPGLGAEWWKSWAPARKLTLKETQEAVNNIAELGNVYKAQVAPGIEPVLANKLAAPSHAAVRQHIAATAQQVSPQAYGPAIAATRARFGPVAAVHDAAAQAAARGTLEQPGIVRAVPQIAREIGAAAAGNAVAGPLGGIGAAALGGAGAMAQRAPSILNAASRAVPAALNGAAHVSEAVAPAAARQMLPDQSHNGTDPSAASASPSQRANHAAAHAGVPHAALQPSEGSHNSALQAKYGRLFHNLPADQRNALDLRLQEILPSYRERRRKAHEEDAAMG
jgi:hypothetical protein